MKLATKKFSSIEDVKKSLKKGGQGSGQWIKNIPAEGLTVRFLTEPDKWFGYFEYWDGTTFVPMAEGEVLPDGAKASFRYLTNAVDSASDTVLPLKLPKSAANSLMMRYEKYGTMLDRDYELDKHGAGLDTTYEVTPTAPSAKSMGKYSLHDLESVLVGVRQEALGETVTHKSEEAQGALDLDPFDSSDLDEELVADDLDEMSKKELRALFDKVRGPGSSEGVSRSDMVSALVDAIEV
jgi:hypothetical protein